MLVQTDLGCTALTKVWLEKKLGSPAKVNRKTIWGKFILNEIEKPLNSYPPTKYPHVLKLQITENFYARRGVILTPDAERNINILIRDHIHDLFFESIEFLNEMQSGKKVKITRAIHTFMERLQLTENEIMCETIKKSYYRKRLEINEAVNQ